MKRSTICAARQVAGHCMILPCDQCADGGCCDESCRCTFCTADERDRDATR